MSFVLVFYGRRLVSRLTAGALAGIDNRSLWPANSAGSSLLECSSRARFFIIINTGEGEKPQRSDNHLVGIKIVFFLFCFWFLGRKKKGILVFLSSNFGSWTECNWNYIRPVVGGSVGCGAVIGAGKAIRRGVAQVLCNPWISITNKQTYRTHNNFNIKEMKSRNFQ